MHKSASRLHLESYSCSCHDLFFSENVDALTSARWSNAILFSGDLAQRQYVYFKEMLSIGYCSLDIGSHWRSSILYTANGSRCEQHKYRSTANLGPHYFNSSTTFFFMSPLKYKEVSRTIHYFKLKNKPSSTYQLGRIKLYIWDRWVMLDWIQQLAISELKVVTVDFFNSCHTWVTLFTQVFSDRFDISIHSFWIKSNISGRGKCLNLVLKNVWWASSIKYSWVCLGKSTNCNTSYEWSLLFINWLYLFGTITSPSSGASSRKLYNALVCSCSQASLAVAWSTQQSTLCAMSRFRENFYYSVWAKRRTEV